MADVVTQPYDKIDSTMQERYYNLSPYNLVRIVLGKKNADDDEEENVYTRAAETLKKWRAEHVLREETAPALYGYSQTYTVPGTGGATGGTRCSRRPGLLLIRPLRARAPPQETRASAPPPRTATEGAICGGRSVEWAFRDPYARARENGSRPPLI